MRGNAEADMVSQGDKPEASCALPSGCALVASRENPYCLKNWSADPAK